MRELLTFCTYTTGLNHVKHKTQDVDLEVFIMAKDDLSGADIKAICTEAGLLALRERRMKVCMDDFVKAKEKALYRKKGNVPEGLYL
jgi:26S proteasome regulatory subunit T2